MRYISSLNGILEGKIHEFGVVAGLENRLAPAGNGFKGGRKVYFLKGPGSEKLQIHLSGKGENGNPIQPGIPEACEEVSCSRTSDGQTCGRRPASLPYAEAAKDAAPSWYSESNYK